MAAMLGETILAQEWGLVVPTEFVTDPSGCGDCSGARSRSGSAAVTTGRHVSALRVSPAALGGTGAWAPPPRPS